MHQVYSYNGLANVRKKKNIHKKKSEALDLGQNVDKDCHGCLSALILDTSLFIFPRV